MPRSVAGTIRTAVEVDAPQPFGGLPGRPERVGELITGQVIVVGGGSETALIGDLRWR
ncbi:hypothetical protein [Nocardia vaccinii]|uniref:hypothetical protein n=1 Tax=Nocardia vaccinii TaxID=1822 RepID=UPI00157C01D2|nr:hypothetical protein [Nocardia vaccinii]